MKKVITGFCFVLIIIGGLCLFTGCEKKDIASKEDRKNVPLIVGKWVHDDSYTYTFNEDGTGNYDVGKVMKFTYKIDGNKITILYDGNNSAFETEFSIKDDVLNIKDSFGNDTLYKRK